MPMAQRIRLNKMYANDAYRRPCRLDDWIKYSLGFVTNAIGRAPRHGSPVYLHL